MKGRNLLLLALLGGVFALALFLRAGRERPVRFDTDEGQYYRLGGAIAGSGLMFEDFPESLSAFRLPLYPAFVAASLKLSDGGWRGVENAQLLLNALAVFLVFYAGLRLHSAACGLLAALLWAVSPLQAERASYLYIESFYSFSVLAVLAGLLYFLERVSVRRALLLGALFGMSFAARSTLFLFPPLLALALLLKRDYRAFRLSLLAYAAALLLLVPWTVRNLAYYGEFIPLEKDAALVNLYTAASGIDTTRPNDEVYARFLAENPGLSRAEADAGMKEAVKAKILGDPAGFLAASARRFAKFCAMTGGVWGNYGPLFAVFSLAALLLLRRETKTLALFYFAAYFLAAHAPMSISHRYLYPLTPVAVLLCAAGLAALLRLAPLRSAWLEPAAPSRGWDGVLLASVAGLALLYGLTVAVAARETARARGYAAVAGKYYAGITAFYKNELQNSIAAFEAVEKDRPSAKTLAKALNGRGVDYILAGRPAEAIPGLERAAAVYPPGIEVYANLHYAALKTGKKAAARAALDAAVTAIAGKAAAGAYDECGDLRASLWLLASAGSGGRPDSRVPALSARLGQLAAESCGAAPASVP